MNSRTIRRLAAATLLALPLSSGCDRTSEENLSAPSSSDPDKFQKAQTEVQDAAARARAAEAKKTKRRLRVEEP